LKTWRASASYIPPHRTNPISVMTAHGVPIAVSNSTKDVIADCAFQA
jgi:uncharacterized protein (DUF1684 family)